MAKHKQSRGFHDSRRDGRTDSGRDNRPNRSDDRRQDRHPPRAPGGRLWLYGRHPVEAALANPKRGKIRLLATAEALAELPEALLKGAKVPSPEVVDRVQIDSLVPDGAVHQGLALLVEPLTNLTIDDLCELEKLI